MKIIKIILNIISLYLFFLFVYLLCKYIGTLNWPVFNEAFNFISKLIEKPIINIYNILIQYNFDILFIVIGSINIFYNLYQKKSKK